MIEWYFDPYMGDDQLKHFHEVGQVVIGLTDEKGNWPTRTKQSHPYSYDPICKYLNHSVKPSGSVYHDRMQQWDYKKYQRVVDEHCTCGNSFSSPVIVQKVLRDYFDDQSIVLTCIVEYCNVSSGYACFRFDYFQEESK